MSEFKNINFVNEFAYRTKLNYYYQKKQFTKNESEISRINAEIQKTKESMAINGFDVADYYEVTDLINSLIGLLVFPEQAAFDAIPTKKKDLKEKFPNLYKSIISDNNYVNSYHLIHEELNSPRDVLRHIKNSLSHKKVMIEPHSGSIGKKRQILAITFKDEMKSKQTGKKYFFSLTVKIECLEDMLMEICDFLINVNG